MQRPNTGELLRGLRKSLNEQVLPALPKGVPYQQMKAALHLMARLERTWDLATSHLADDNADIEAVLGDLLPSDGAGSLDERLSATEAMTPAGYNDAGLREAAERNLALHQVLLTLPYSAPLAALHIRMSRRDSRFVGDRTVEEDTEG
ncbi:MAG: hypothetical protein WCY11_14880 [Novosphingobium sp.]